MPNRTAIVVYFPVDPHVYKYLQKKVGEKLQVSKNNFFGSMVLDVMAKKDSDLKMGNTTLSFPAEISIRYMEKEGFHIDSRSIRKFNARIDDVFREEMRGHILVNYEQHNIPKEKSLRAFLLSYNITEDDIKFETLVKDFKRNAVRAEG